jgi:two-component system sensor histidine kinase TctE
MARLAQTLETERSFLADATHQLRTPITVLRTQTELALRTNDLPALRTHVEQMDVASRRLTRLANQLLNLSWAEAGRGGLAEVTRVDLIEVLEDVLAQHEPLAHAKRQTLECLADAKHLCVKGSPLMLGEMIANLIDNAIRYTPPGGRIQVEAGGDEENARVTVRDDGPGIPEAERLQVLNRFYRGTTATDAGSGLGLAIVQEIALAHGGRLMLRPSLSDGTGVSATVELPRCAD